MCKGIIRAIRIVWLNRGWKRISMYYRRKGLLLFPMTSNRRNFPRLILLDSVSMGRNRENGFGSSGGSRCWRRERNLTSTALLEFQRRPKRDSRFFSRKDIDSVPRPTNWNVSRLVEKLDRSKGIRWKNCADVFFWETRFDRKIDIKKSD